MPRSLLYSRSLLIFSVLRYSRLDCARKISECVAFQDVRPVKRKVKRF